MREPVDQVPVLAARPAASLLRLPVLGHRVRRPDRRRAARPERLLPPRAGHPLRQQLRGGVPRQPGRRPHRRLPRAPGSTCPPASRCRRQPRQLGALPLLQLLADASRGVGSDELHSHRPRPRPVARVPEPAELRGRRGPRAGRDVDGLKVLGRAARVAGAKGAGRLREARQARVPDGVDGARGLRGVQRERRAVVPARWRRRCV